MSDDLQPFYLDRTIEEQFGSNVLFVMVVKSDTPHVDIRAGGNPNVPKPGFPKEDLKKLEDVTQITVIPWESSPGCRTICSNGNCYERC
jgi:hypothetical protein